MQHNSCHSHNCTISTQQEVQNNPPTHQKASKHAKCVRKMYTHLCMCAQNDTKCVLMCTNTMYLGHKHKITVLFFHLLYSTIKIWPHNTFQQFNPSGPFPPSCFFVIHVANHKAPTQLPLRPSTYLTAQLASLNRPVLIVSNNVVVLIKWYFQ